jgi:hypothetical protein
LPPAQYGAALLLIFWGQLKIRCQSPLEHELSL